MSLAADIEVAREHAVLYLDTDPTYAELMATYVELGERLWDGPTDAEFELDCRDLVARVVGLGRRLTTEYEQAIAAATARVRVWRAA